MSARIPLTADVAVLFALSFAGIVFVLVSQAASVKRLVLPLTLVVFHVMAFLILQRSGALANVPVALLVAALAANAIMVWWRVGYCSACGRTVRVVSFGGGAGTRPSQAPRVERAIISPHRVHDPRETTRHRHHGDPFPTTLGDAHRPRPQRRRVRVFRIAGSATPPPPTGSAPARCQFS